MALIPFGTLYEGIRDAARSVWTFGKCYAGAPRVKATAPYVVVSLAGSERIFGNTVKCRYRHTFEIRGKFPFPASAGDLIEYEKAEKAGQIMGALMAAPVFAGTGGLPTVTSVEFDEADAPNERAYEVVVVFSVETEGNRDNT